MRHAVLAFGPGFASSGTRVEVELSASGIRLATRHAPDGEPGWADIEVSRSGWDGSQPRLEWRGQEGRYALLPADKAAAEALLEAVRPRITNPSRDHATRAWSLSLIVLFVLLPLVLLALLVSQHDRLAGWAVALIPAEQERRLGELVFEQHKSRLKLLEGPADEMVRAIGGRLTKGSRYPYRFHVAQDASVNAFALPGGFVVVHTGLLGLAGTAEEVAGVLAHEVSHVEKRHSLKAMAKSLGLSASIALVFGDLGGLASLGGELASLRFSRDHENEADREGLRALQAAGIRPQGMHDFFRRMAERQSLDLGFLSTHPASADRMAAIDRAIRALPADALTVPPLPYDYSAVKASLPAK